MHKKRKTTRNSTKMTDMHEERSFAIGDKVLSNCYDSDVGSNCQYSVPRSDNGGQFEVVQKKTKEVISLKLLLIITLILSAAGAGCVSFLYLRAIEDKKFQSAIKNDVRIVRQSIATAIEESLLVLDLISTNLLIYAHSSNKTWPNVTLPGFPELAAKSSITCMNVQIYTAVVIKLEDRFKWEQYSWENRFEVINGTNQFMETDVNYHGSVFWDVQPSLSIFGSEGPIPQNESRTFLPTWQAYPIITNESYAYNWDTLSDADPEAIERVLYGKQAVVGEPYLNPDPNDAGEMEDAKFWAEYFSAVVSPGVKSKEPASDIMYPIIAKGSGDSSLEDSIVGVVGAVFFWRDLLNNELESAYSDTVVVFASECSHAFTYLISGSTNGSKVELLGRGDLHDTRFDHLGSNVRLDNFTSYSTKKSIYTGVPMENEYCPMNINIYPSEKMERHYLTATPLLAVITTVLIFMFTSLLFILYDWKVERRQQMVMTSAERSNFVLSALFPSSVREKVLEAGAQSNQERRNSIASTTIRPQATADIVVNVTKPIADLYTDTTVLFCDIAGFTKWSSACEPYQVFTFLETLYGEFDKIAKDRGVFKVETIGDSYMAVTGIPTPMKNHAANMVRFARDILSRMKQVTEKLSYLAEADTKMLNLRVGLHSGPCTAGVLRGEKSRFQLFGDTVNTASRMESLGIPGQIQCSQSTVDLLAAQGKEHWFIKRENMIEAKGKGLLQSYWIVLAPGTNIVNTELLHVTSDQLEDSTNH